MMPKKIRPLADHFEALFARVRYLRDELEEKSPPDDDFRLLFADVRQYPALGDDGEVGFHLTVLRGLAIGLGFASSLELYAAYRARPKGPRPNPELGALVAAAERALQRFTRAWGPAAVEGCHELDAALAPFRAAAAETPSATTLTVPPTLPLQSPSIRSGTSTLHPRIRR